MAAIVNTVAAPRDLAGSPGGSLRVVSGRAVVAAATTAIDGIGLFASLIMLARWLGPQTYGEVWTAYALATLVLQLTEGGLVAGMTRSAARDPRGLPVLLSHMLGLRLVVTAASLILLAGIAAAIVPALLVPVMLFGAAASVVQMSQVFSAAFRATGRVGLELATVFAERAALVVLVLALARGWTAGLSVVAVFAIAALVRFAVAVALVSRLAPVRVAFDIDAWRPLVRGTFALGLTRLFTVIAWRVDVVMLAILLPAAAIHVGHYNAAFAIFSGSAAIGAAANLTLMPYLASMLAADRAGARRLAYTALGALAAIGVGVAGVIAIGAERLVAALYGAEYAPSADLLQTLTPAVVAVHLMFVAGAVLTAFDRAGQVAAIVVMTAAVNVGLNAWWIPSRAAAGAAAATAVSESAGAIAAVVLMRRRLQSAEAPL